LLERLEESDTMGFLNRRKKQTESDDHEKIDIKTTEEITHEQQSNEFQGLQSQISENETHLASITEKLELTRKEYQNVISDVMSSKKKLLEIKKQIQSAYAEFDLAPKQEEHQKILVEITQSKNELTRIKKELEIFNPQKLESVKINDELEQRKKELEIIKTKLINSKSKIKKDDGNSKQILESASQVVASTNKKLQKALKELDMMKQVLEKERKAHNETKKKLKSL
jgi:DNA repair exonuclease SbcCD ATPase subunit